MDNNDDKQFEEKEKKKLKLNKAKMAEFFKRNGFYIALFICIVAAGLTAILSLTSSGPNPPLESAAVSDGQQVEQMQDNTLEEAKSSQVPFVTLTPSATPSPTTTPSPETTKKPPAKSSAQLQAPVKGKIIKSFSIDKLSFNKTLNQWSTHNGVDIQAKEGDTVVAAISGTVETVYSDQLYGGVVVIKTSDNRKVVYAGVVADEKVKENGKVTAGQTLGVVKTPNFEAWLGPHLHFEYVDGADYADPAESF